MNFINAKEETIILKCFWKCFHPSVISYEHKLKVYAMFICLYRVFLIVCRIKLWISLYLVFDQFLTHLFSDHSTFVPPDTCSSDIPNGRLSRWCSRRRETYCSYTCDNGCTRTRDNLYCASNGLWMYLEGACDCKGR